MGANLHFEGTSTASDVLANPPIAKNAELAGSVPICGNQRACHRI
jgi:hypothetical protein